MIGDCKGVSCLTGEAKFWGTVVDYYSGRWKQGQHNEDWIRVRKQVWTGCDPHFEAGFKSGQGSCRPKGSVLWEHVPVT